MNKLQTPKGVVAVSVVSHGHGEMVWDLVKQLLYFSEVTEIVLTINIPEEVPDFQDSRVKLVFNSKPKGFGENHNSAFKRTDSTSFCVLNPDIVFERNPFPVLLQSLKDSSVVGLVAPLVVGPNGAPEDSMRRFLTPWSMVTRVLGIDSGLYPQQQASCNPDWVAGMFMLFQSDSYAKVCGFDERYFMYCEDADICTRLWKTGYKVVGCLSASVIHNAQRASHRSFKHLCWHVRSMVRYFLSYSLSLPKT